jgi:acetyltransferase
VGALDPAERQALRAVLPPSASLSNPVDLVGDADAKRYADALHAIVPGASADAVLVTLTAQAATDSASVARAIAAGTRGWRVPVAATFVGGSRVIAGIRALDEAGIPCYPFPERAVRVLRGMASLGERRAVRRRWLAVSVSREELARHMTSLRSAEARRFGLAEIAPLLALYGIDVAAGRLAASAEDAAAVARAMGGAVAIKVASPDVLHKTEVGGVVLGLAGPDVVRREADAMLSRVRAARPAARIDGIYVQPMVARGHELLLGMVRDPQFGPLVMVGFGGIYVEVLRDTATGIPPLAEADALAMLEELRMAPVLRGVRGALPVDREALVRTICRFAQLVTDVDDFAELELNPLMVSAAGAIAVDARGALREPGA